MKSVSAMNIRKYALIGNFVGIENPGAFHPSRISPLSSYPQLLSQNQRRFKKPQHLPEVMP
jgi:hypothetical protein